MNKIIRGDDLMLFDSDKKSLALATSHSLSISADMKEVNSKDHGIWGSAEVGKISWSISTENLYSTVTFDDLFDKMINRTPITVYFGLKKQLTATGTVDEDGVSDGQTPPTYNWTPNDDGASPTPALKGIYTGKAYITELSANAPSGENATFTCSLQGVGSLVRND